MEVKLEKRYPLAVDAKQAWQVLRDVKATAECMPGAAITAQTDATHYKGSVKVKVGPANAAFAGDIEVLGLDEASKTLQLLGKGADRGGSSASMDLTATVAPGDLPGTSVLVGHAAVIVNGKFAQFGGRLMVQVSDMLLAQFADNFRAAAASIPAPVPVPVAAAVTAPPVVTAVTAPPVVATATAPPVADLRAAPSASTDAGPVVATPPAAPPATPARVNEINAGSIFWSLLKNWFAGLFGKRSV